MPFADVVYHLQQCRHERGLSRAEIARQAGVPAVVVELVDDPARSAAAPVADDDRVIAALPGASARIQTLLGLADGIDAEMQRLLTIWTELQVEPKRFYCAWGYVEGMRALLPHWHARRVHADG